MKRILLIVLLSLAILLVLAQENEVVIDESGNYGSIEQIVYVDSVWAGHPVGFSLLSHGNRQYIAYYNAERRMVLGQRNIGDKNFDLHVLPATMGQQSLIVDPVPVEGGLINLAARLLLDENDKPVFVYHKFDENGNTQLYVAQIQEDKWVYHAITDWGYRWFFSGNGSINSEIKLNGFRQRDDGSYEVDYRHIKYGNGTILLDSNFCKIGKVIKPLSPEKTLEIEGTFPGLLIQTANDLGEPNDGFKYVLKWETINRNRDKPRKKPWPEPSRLYLLKIK